MEAMPTRDLLDAARFARCWRALGATHDERAFEVLVSSYSESHRAYHTGEHIEECLQWLQRLRDLATSPDQLAVALYFHDAVYDPRRSDNERRSAELFSALAGRAGIPTAVIRSVAQLIKSTEMHAGLQGDAALMSDIDLAILSAPPERYARYEADIRREYGFCDEACYRLGRGRVLRGFLERPCLYRTARMAGALEANARENLRRASWALDDQEVGHVRVGQEAISARARSRTRRVR